MLLLDVLISTRENQQTISDMSGRAPDLLAIDFPAAIDLFRCCTHAAQAVGPAGRLRKRDRGFKLPRGYERQIFLLLLFAALASNGLGSRSEEHTSEHKPLMRTSYAFFCLEK